MSALSTYVMYKSVYLKSLNVSDTQTLRKNGDVSLEKASFIWEESFHTHHSKCVSSVVVAVFSFFGKKTALQFIVRSSAK